MHRPATQRFQVEGAGESRAICDTLVIGTTCRRLGCRAGDPDVASPMNCSFSGLPVPTEKLFVLYYPPAAAHETWHSSFFAAARAREALEAIVEALEHFFGRYVVSTKVVPGLVAAIAGTALALYWGSVAYSGWSGMGFSNRYLVPLFTLVVLLFARSRLRGFFYRWRVWRTTCRETVAKELAAIRRVRADIPDDPDAEEAAAIMRRECPAVLSDIAFFGNNFNAFTYMDFVLSPKLEHPGEQQDLPPNHSLHRDAYYVGDVVYDNWRTFHKDRRTPSDPRFIGSGGRRGVI